MKLELPPLPGVGPAGPDELAWYMVVSLEQFYSLKILTAFALL